LLGQPSEQETNETERLDSGCLSLVGSNDDMAD
jgi:hypothetical protein